MDDPDRIPALELPPGTVRRGGDWAGGNRGEDLAVCPGDDVVLE